MTILDKSKNNYILQKIQVLRLENKIIQVITTLYFFKIRVPYLPEDTIIQSITFNSPFLTH